MRHPRGKPAPATTLPPPKPIGVDPSQTAVPPLPRVDWQAYFTNVFCPAHGTWYVVDGGRLIFPDGWTYAADDYAGPEWPPPANLEHLAEILRTYWKRRREIVLKERDKLRGVLESLRTAQEQRPLDLVERKFGLSESTGNWLYYGEVGPIDWDARRERLKWLNDDLLLCDKELLALGERL